MNIPILLYHGINITSSQQFNRWVVHPSDFERHLTHLIEKGYVPVSIGEIVRCINTPLQTLPEKAVGITFDDGFEDFYTYAMPLIVKYKIPATIYVVAGYVGTTSRWLATEGEGDNPMMSWEQIRELDRLGIEIGSHTMNHYALDTLPLDRAAREIFDSKTLLEQNLGHEIRSFAYPHGYYNHNVRELVQRAGFTSACAVKHGLSSTNDDPFALARIIVSNGTSLQSLDNLMAGRGLLPVTQQERMRTKVWRLYRRVLSKIKYSEIAGGYRKEGDPLYGKSTGRQ